METWFSQPGEEPHKANLRRLALNNCGINGREAARLIRSLGRHANVHLHISGNPLEDGIEDFFRAIAMTPGPAGLHMNMLEFRHEAKFVALMKALASNRKISALGLAGTAPTASADGPCRSEVCDALRHFFEKNQSVKYLDLSGYSGRLDEGQLGQGFAQSLRGLASNHTLTHLRIRNQNLHDDVGTLGSVIRQNATLRIVDCQDNNWNLTSVQFLTKSLKLNQSIVHFPFSPKEYERVWARIMCDLRRQSVAGKPAVAAQQEAALRTALQRQIQELRETVQQNCDALEPGTLSAVWEQDYLAESDEESVTAEESHETMAPNDESGKFSKKIRRPLSMNYPKAAARQQKRQSLQVLDPDSDLVTTPVDPPVAEITRRVHEIFLPLSMTIHSDAVDAVDIKDPYHVGQDPEAMLLLETPPGAASPNDDDFGGGNSPTTPEAPVSPTTPPPSLNQEEDLRKKDQTGSIGGSSPRTTSGFDLVGPYSRSAASRFRIGGLEAHEEE